MLRDIPSKTLRKSLLSTEQLRAKSDSQDFEAPGVVSIFVNNEEPVETIDEARVLSRVREYLFAMQAPTQVGRYQLDERIGEGGLGVVYSAYDPWLRRKVAIKLLRSTSSRGLLAGPELLQEAQALACIEHPNVVAVHDVGVFDPQTSRQRAFAEDEGESARRRAASESLRPNCPLAAPDNDSQFRRSCLPGEACGGDESRVQVYMVMEYVEGTVLDRWLRQNKPSLLQLLDAFIQAGRGLWALHQHGWVHGDVKPQNMIMDADGRVRILDLGSAFRVEERRSSAPSPGVTPHYLAPECRPQKGQRNAGAPANEKSDQYAFARGLADALAAWRAQPEPPDRREPARKGEFEIGCLPGAKVEHDDQRVFPRLEAVLRRALQKTPQARYSTMRSLLQVLESLRDEYAKSSTPAGAALRSSLNIVLYSRSTEGAFRNSHSRGWS